MNNPDKPDRTGSSSSSSSSDSSDSDKVRKKMKKLKKKIKKEERRTAKRLKKKLKSERKKLKKATKSKSKEKRRSPSPVPTAPLPETVPVVTAPEKSSNVPLGLMERSMAPMTREEWEKRQAVIRKVLDEDTGRYRLIKGDGEVLEELVPLKRHKEINKHATQADGAYFLKHSHSHARR